MDGNLILLFAGGLFFSLLLYLGDRVPWVFSVIGGAFSSLFWWGLSLYWVGTSSMPELGWLFSLWAVVNLTLMVAILLGAFAEPAAGRFD